LSAKCVSFGVEEFNGVGFLSVREAKFLGCVSEQAWQSLGQRDWQAAFMCWLLEESAAADE